MVLVGIAVNRLNFLGSTRDRLFRVAVFVPDEGLLSIESGREGTQRYCLL
jgi:hypothetical protein